MTDSSDRAIDDATEDSPLVAIAVGAALVTMFALAGVLNAAGVGVWWIAFPIGGGLVPLAVGLAKWYEDREAEADTETGRDALEQLRERYARGEIDEAEFERRLERLLETESVPAARQSVAERRERNRDRTRELE